jgi:hypothetical protein
MSKIDPYVREMCWTGDLFISSISPTQPVFELEWDPGPISTARVTEINQLLSCPTGTVLLKMDVFEEDPVFRSPGSRVVVTGTCWAISPGHR